jgi:hypothetical protein
MRLLTIKSQPRNYGLVNPTSISSSYHRLPMVISKLKSLYRILRRKFHIPSISTPPKSPAQSPAHNDQSLPQAGFAYTTLLYAEPPPPPPPPPPSTQHLIPKMPPPCPLYDYRPVTHQTNTEGTSKRRESAGLTPPLADIPDQSPCLRRHCDLRYLSTFSYPFPPFPLSRDLSFPSFPACPPNRLPTPHPQHVSHTIQTLISEKSRNYPHSSPSPSPVLPLPLLS